MTNVTINRYSAHIVTVSPLDTSWWGWSNQLLDTTAASGSSPQTVTLGNFVVTGTGLSLDAQGRLAGGTITHIAMFIEADMAAEWGSGDAGGLNLSVTALRAAQGDANLLDALFAEWVYAYSNEGTTDHYGYAMTFEGGRNADTLKGSTGMDVLRGAGGSDTVLGGDGDDELWGDDTQFGPMPEIHGNDTLHGEAGDDWISGDGGDDQIFGGTGNDILHGDTWAEVGDDTIRGGAGNDEITGGLGNDALVGGAGTDTLAARNLPDDTVIWVVNLDTGTSSGQGKDTISGFENVRGSLYAKNHIVGDAKANSILAGQNTDVLKGAGGNDRLDGYWGDDKIQGGAGADLLWGDEGNDTLWGGSGRDAFVFHHAGAAHGDRIQDFHSADDNIYLAGNLLDWDSGFWGHGPIAANLFKNLSSGTQDGDDKVLYNRATGELWFDRDGLGELGPELLCQLDPGTRLSANDVHLRWDM
jgi:Ca2+-binding RTX toxin-like protein